MLTFVSNHTNIKWVELTLPAGPKDYAGIKCWCGLRQEPAHFVTKANMSLLGLLQH